MPSTRYRAGRWLRVTLAIISALLLLPVWATEASAATKRSVLFVVDTSNSMAGARLTQAKNALKVSVSPRALGDSVLAGLHRYGGECGDGGTLLVAPGVGADNRDRLQAAIGGLTTSGGTPTPDALRLAVTEFPSDATERIIVLISDGESTCGDPCPVVRELQRTAQVKFKAVTVGFQTSSQAEAELTCIARVTGGRHFRATDTAGIQAAIRAALAGGDTLPITGFPTRWALGLAVTLILGGVGLLVLSRRVQPRRR